jgi:phage tail protein X
VRRLGRGIAATLALLLGLVGLPLALVKLGSPWPAGVDWGLLGEALFTPDDGTILLGLLTVAGWVAWLVFAVSVLAELVALASHQRLRIRVPGLAGPQRLAAVLLVAVVAILSLPHLPNAPPESGVPSAPGPVVPAVTAPPSGAPDAPVNVAREADEPMQLTGPTGRDQTVRHRVASGDDLWTLAERYYGKGQEWRKIAAANPTVLTGGPDRLQPGWTLVIPDVESVAEGGVTVRPGDTLSSIAAAELGSADAWSALYAANRSQLDDPNELAVGMRLSLPEKGAAATVDRSDSPLPRPIKAPMVETTPQVPDAASEVPAPELPDPAPEVSDGPGRDLAPPPPVESAAPRASPAADPAPAGSSSPESVSLAPLAGAGGLLAAGLISALALRRRTQLQARPLGRRIAHPPLSAQRLEVAAGRRQRPLSLRTLDQATRAIAAHCRATGEPLPPFQYAVVGDEQIELVFRSISGQPPVGFTARGRSWLVNHGDVGYLRSVPGLGEASRPWPALVSLGHDEDGRQIVADLEEVGLLQLSADDPADSDAVLAAMAVELSFSPWADEMILTLVGGCAPLPEVLGKHNVTAADDLADVLHRLEQRAAAQRHQPEEPVLAQHRLDPDLADPWAPEIVLINRSMSAAERARLEAVVVAAPRVTMAAVIVDTGLPAPWALEITRTSEGLRGRLTPAQLSLRPQYLDVPSLAGVIDLVAATGTDATTPAPWWDQAGVDPPGRPPDNVALLRPGADGGGGTGQGTGPHSERGEDAMSAIGALLHPTLQLIGPVELLGAAGDPPPRAGKQCLEYCAWLLEHPGTTAQAMAAALVVAEGTRRSNMSRLRGWLGSDALGRPYLPDAYTGRILLHPDVSSDWLQLQVLTTGGVNRAATESLKAALHLVRGAPLADAAPGQWHWAEELRTDIISCLRDIGVELADRALAEGDLDLARWAAARALVAAPGDELLLAARIRTEHRAGNAADTERLTLQLAAQSRALGVDLNPATVTLLQEVMEGRVRARLA